MGVLTVTDDDLLLEEVQRQSAALGVSVHVERDPEPALRAWSHADIVLVGADLAPAVALLRPPRRAGVHVLAPHAADPDVLRAALRVGAEGLVEPPRAERWLGRVLADVEAAAAPPATVTGVIGGSGGAGASVLAAALAQHLAASSAALLVDLDPGGAGADRLLGVERRDGVRWADLGRVSGRLGARELREALPRAGERVGPGVLAWGVDRTPPDPLTVREVIDAGARGHAHVVIDLPRGGDLTEEVLARCTDVLLVSHDRLASLAAAAPRARRLADAPGRAGVVVRRGAGAPPERVAAALDLPLLAAMAPQRGLDEALDLGAGPLRRRRGPLARAVAELGRRLEAGR